MWDQSGCSYCTSWPPARLRWPCSSIRPSPELAEAESKEQRAAASALGVQLHVLQAIDDSDFDTVFAKVVELRAVGVVIGTDLLFNTRKERLAALSISHRVPTIYQYREFAGPGAR